MGVSRGRTVLGDLHPVMSHPGSFLSGPEPLREGVINEGVHIARNARDDTSQPSVKELLVAESLPDRVALKDRSDVGVEKRGEFSVLAGVVNV